MMRLSQLMLAAACLVLGLLTLPTPVPTGLPLIGFGLFLLLQRPALRRALLGIRQRNAWLDRLMQRCEPHMPWRLRRLLGRRRRSSP